MDFSYKTVSLSCIDADDERFRISSCHGYTDLLRSINDLGLLHPPLLLPVAHHYIIISGFFRVAACKELGLKQITAGLTDSHTPANQCVVVAIADNTAHRSLNIVEQARAMQLLAGEYDHRQEIQAAALSAGLRLNDGLMTKLEKVALMPGVIKAGLVDGTISLPVALTIHEMKDEANASENIGQLLGDLRLSLNQQREIVDAIKAITRHEEISIHTLLNEGPIVTWLGTMDMDHRQKAQHIRRYLKMRRYPTIAAVENQFAQLRKQLALKKGIQLLAPPNFESRTYALRLEFEKVEELKQLPKELNRLLDAPEIMRLWDLYK
jgi:ParB family chromosome partitioning protein